MPKLYTKYGDCGTTFTAFHHHTPKDHIIVKLVGELDELNCNIGFSASFCDSCKDFKNYLQDIQAILFEFGAIVGYNQETKKESLQTIIKEMEEKIDEVDSKNEKLKNFILPGGNQLSASLHICRSIARRVERTFVEYINWNIDNKPVQNIDLVKMMQIYINRISDYFFAAARHYNYCNNSSKHEDIIWKSKLTHKPNK
jgi:cob(I)alamin adenosyltransferase